MSAQKTDLLLRALLEHSTIKAAADAVGIPYSTARRLLDDPDAQAALADLRQQAAREAVLEATHLARLARETLAAIMADDSAPPHARVRAAEAALAYEKAVSELFDVHQRLAAIEAALERNGTQVA